MNTRLFNSITELGRFLYLSSIPKEDVVFIGYDPTTKCWCLIYDTRK